MIPILIVSSRRDRELSKLHWYRRNDRVAVRLSYSGLGISSRASRGIEIGSTARYISAISPNRRSRQRNTTLGLLPRAHRVHRRHHLRRIHNFARSLPNRLLALSLSSSLPFPVLLLRPLFSRIRCVTKLSQCPEASISMPNVATWLNVVRNSSTSLSGPPYIAAGNFGPGSRGKGDDEAAFSIHLDRAAGSRWKKLWNGVDVGV